MQQGSAEEIIVHASDCSAKMGVRPVVWLTGAGIC